MLRGSSCGMLRCASSVLPCVRGSRRARMPSCEPCAPLRSSSRLASCTSSAPARPFSFWVAAVRTSRGRLLPASVELAAARSVQPLVNLIRQIVSPTIHAAKVQIAATVKATATAQSQISISLSFILHCLRISNPGTCRTSVVLRYTSSPFSSSSCSLSEFLRLSSSSTSSSTGSAYFGLPYVMMEYIFLRISIS